MKRPESSGKCSIVPGSDMPVARLRQNTQAAGQAPVTGSSSDLCADKPETHQSAHSGDTTGGSPGEEVSLHRKTGARSCVVYEHSLLAAEAGDEPVVS